MESWPGCSVKASALFASALLRDGYEDMEDFSGVEHEDIHALGEILQAIRDEDMRLIEDVLEELGYEFEGDRVVDAVVLPEHGMGAAQLFVKWGKPEGKTRRRREEE